MRNLMIIALFLTLSAPLFAQQKYQPVRTALEELNEKYTSGLFRNVHSTDFDLENDNANVSGYLNILNWLQGRVAGLQVYNYRGMQIPVIRNYVAQVYVDEMRVDPSFLNMLSVNDIALVKVIKQPFMGGFNGAGGAIAVYTKRGEGEEEEVG